LEQNELKTDAKIDMLHQYGLFSSPTKKPAQYNINDEISEEEDIENSLV
jgi:kinesin family protein 20